MSTIRPNGHNFVFRLLAVVGNIEFATKTFVL